MIVSRSQTSETARQHRSKHRSAPTPESAASRRVSSEKNYDLVVVGTGTAGIHTILGALKGHGPSPLKIASIDPSTMAGGVAYGEPSSISSLTVSTLDEFLPADELRGFVEWLSEDFDLLAIATKARSFASHEVFRAWVRRNRQALDAGNWGPLQVPRRWYGEYLEAQLVEAQKTTKHHYSRLQGVVTSLEPCASDGGYRIGTSNDMVLRCANVVLASGTHRPASAIEAEGDLGRLIENPYAPSMDRTLDSIAALSTSDNRVPHVGLIGANASALELVYHIAHAEALDVEVTLINGDGLPAFHPNGPDVDGWPSPALESLAVQETVTSAQVVEAVLADMVRAEGNSLTTSQAIRSTRSGMHTALQRLSSDELLQFANFDGPSVMRRQRRFGPEMRLANDHLFEQERMHLATGRVTHLSGSKNGTTVTWDNSDNHTTDQHFDLVINCSGTRIGNSTRPKNLLDHLTENDVISRTLSGRGILVDESLQAAPNLYYIGPMLAGNVLAGKAVWHLEHCGRLIGLSKTLAQTLSDSFVAATA